MLRLEASSMASGGAWIGKLLFFLSLIVLFFLDKGSHRAFLSLSHRALTLASVNTLGSTKCFYSFEICISKNLSSVLLGIHPPFPTLTQKKLSRVLKLTIKITPSLLCLLRYIWWTHNAVFKTCTAF
jgi:hypothetical protein